VSEVNVEAKISQTGDDDPEVPEKVAIEVGEASAATLRRLRYLPPPGYTLVMDLYLKPVEEA
jgi:hypothetical protein